MRVKTHIILGFISIICLILLTQIEFGLIILNPFDISIENCKKINTFLYILFTGFILSTMFYYIVKYLPDREKAKITHQIIDKKLIRIGHFCNILIEYIRVRNNKKNYNEFKDSNLNQFTNQKIAFVCYQKIKDDEWIAINYPPEPEIKFIEYAVHEIITTIEYILDLSFVQTVEFTLIKNLSDLRECDFFNDLRLLKNIDYNVQLKNINQDFLNMIEIYKNLIKFKEHKENMIKSIDEL